jgi:hypothetical protein
MGLVKSQRFLVLLSLVLASGNICALAQGATSSDDLGSQLNALLERVPKEQIDSDSVQAVLQTLSKFPDRITSPIGPLYKGRGTDRTPELGMVSYQGELAFAILVQHRHVNAGGILARTTGFGRDGFCHGTLYVTSDRIVFVSDSKPADSFDVKKSDTKFAGYMNERVSDSSILKVQTDSGNYIFYPRCFSESKVSACTDGASFPLFDAAVENFRVFSIAFAAYTTQ